MKRVLFGLGFAAVLAAQACAGAQPRPDADAANQVKSIRVRDYKDRTVVVIEGTARPTYTVFKLSSPHRVVIDLANTKVKPASKALKKSPKAMVKSVATRQFGEGKGAVGRIEFVLPRHANFASAVRDNRLVLEIPKYKKVARRVKTPKGQILTQQVEEQPPIEEVGEADLAPAGNEPPPATEETFVEQPAEAPAEAAPAEAAPAEAAPAEAAPAEAAPAEAAPAEAAPAEAAPAEAAPAEAAPAEAAPAEPAPLAEEPAPVEAAPAEPAPLAEQPPVEAAPAEPEQVPAETAPLVEQAPAEPAPAEPAAPAEAPAPPPLAGPAEEAAPIEDEGAELARKALQPSAQEPAPEEGFVEELPPAEPAAQEPVVQEPAVEAVPAPIEAVPAPIETVPAPVVAAPAEEPKATTKILDIQVTPGDGMTTVTVTADNPLGDFNAFKLENPTRLVIDIWNVGNLFPTKELDIKRSGFKTLRLGQYADKVRLVLDASGKNLPKYNVTKDGASLKIELGEQAVEQAPKVVLGEEEGRKVTTIRKETAAPVVTSSLTEDRSKKRYKGRRISLDFQGADIRDMIRLIAEVSALNIITADDVKGTMTIRLINVPWDQALDVILDSQGLGMVRIGNVVRIAPKDRLASEEKQRLESMKAQAGLEPLYVKIVPVNYADAGELASRVQPILSERGSVAVDTRTNVLIIKDVTRNIDDATSLIENLDTQTPQVLIEAKIVEANTNFARDLGVQWGGAYNSGPGFGNGTGMTFPNTIGMTGGNAGAPGTPQTPNFAVNLPAAAGAGSGGAVSFLFGSLTNSLVLDLRLSALESAGQGRVISSPRITTLNNRQASIQQGISIPFETTSAQGTQTQFIDAVIKLTVTPHITADRSVIMKIKAEKNAPETALRSAGGAPSISKKEAVTEVLVKDGETTVIGGIFQISKSENQQGVPFFSKIPIIGWFFQKNTSEDTRSELLVFITPRIVTKKPTVKAETGDL